MRGSDMVMTLIAGIESLLLAALTVSALAVAGQGTDSFSPGTQWALYTHAASLVASIVLQCMAAASTGASSSNRWAAWCWSAASELADAHCAATFHALVCYAVLFASASAMLAEERGGSASRSWNATSPADGREYRFTRGEVWFAASVGDAFTSWEASADGSHYTSSLSRLGPSGTTTAIVGQVYVGATAAYLLVMLLASLYVSYTAAHAMGGAPRLFLDSRSLSATNVFVVLALGQAVEVGFGLCKAGAFSGDALTAALLSFLFLGADDAVVLLALYVMEWRPTERAGRLLDYASARSGGIIVEGGGTAAAAYEESYRRGVCLPLVSTAFAATPLGILVARIVSAGGAVSAGGVPVLAASCVLAGLAVVSAWARWAGQPGRVGGGGIEVQPNRVDEEMDGVNDEAIQGEITVARLVQDGGDPQLRAGQRAPREAIPAVSALGERPEHPTLKPHPPTTPLAPSAQRQGAGSIQWTVFSSAAAPPRDHRDLGGLLPQQQQQQQRQRGEKSRRYVA